MRLGEIAALIRSKNAGPFELTFDIMFDSPGNYELVVRSGVVTPRRFAELYGVPEEDVRLFTYPAGLAIKVTIPRPYPSGDPMDTDVFGGQQYGPLVDLEVPDRLGQRT